MRRLICILSMVGILLFMTGCNKGITYSSSVPTRPVHVDINTATGLFVHFLPAYVGSYLTITQHGYYLNRQYAHPLHEGDFVGYAGLVVVVDCYSQYSAFDMCCPHCLRPDMPVEVIDGTLARCPLCGEEYNLAFGIGDPMHGVAKEALRKYQAIPSGDRLSIRNQP